MQIFSHKSRAENVKFKRNEMVTGFLKILAAVLVSKNNEEETISSFSFVVHGQ
jgi:hypothetical protein